MWFIISLISAFILDRIFGDPYNIPHPVVYMGKLISESEAFFRKIFPDTDRGKLIAGIFLWIELVSVSFFIPFIVLKITYRIHFIIGFALQIFWMYQILAAGCLETESMKVYNALKDKDVEKARKQLSYLVGRDTYSLNEEEIIKATIETVAENTSDGVTAPMFYMFIGGVPLGFLYKAVNTMDSMVGYKNEKYMYFGRFSAYMDDIFNFIPSRITGCIMIISAVFLKMDWKSALKVFIRDRKKHLSPNSAQTESAVAGALGIQLGGTHNYFGKPVEKPLIGDNSKKAEAEEIKKSCRLMYLTSFIFLIAGICVYLILNIN